MRVNIFTYLTGYNSKIYERFAGSLFDTGFDGNLYLFVHDKDLVTLSELDQSLVDKICIVNCPDHMNNQDQSTDDESTDSTDHIHPQNFRYLLYLGFLQQNRQPKQEYSLFCDARDVLFQKNPNDYIIDDKFDMFVFQEETVIKECPFNTGFLNMVRSCIPDGNFDYTSNKAVCSGTILVKNSSLHNFIVTFCKTMMDHNLNKHAMMDQGLHNYLFFNGLYNCRIKVLTNRDNLINTIGVEEATKAINDNGQIVNDNNDVSYIVHQYDRMDNDTLKQISTKYDFT